MAPALITALAPLLAHTYIRTDMVYRLSLVAEFLNFAFFTDGATTITKETFSHFAKLSRDPLQDSTFLQELPLSFWNTFTRNSFQKTLDRMEEEIASVPTLPLTIPIAIPSEQMAQVGQWVRTVVGENTLLDISIDQTLAAGCQFVWKDKMYDFSFAHYEEAHLQELAEQLSPLIAKQNA